MRLATTTENGVAELRVADDGAGFPTDFLPHAFERFSRPHGARPGGTAGLGLAIVAAVAEAHGGTASAANDGGAVVTISIPRE